MPIGAVWPVAIKPTPNRKATLFTGPPMSNAIIRPRMMPNTTALAPVNPDSQFVSPVKRPAMGAPRT